MESIVYFEEWLLGMGMGLSAQPDEPRPTQEEEGVSGNAN